MQDWNVVHAFADLLLFQQAHPIPFLIVSTNRLNNGSSVTNGTALGDRAKSRTCCVYQNQISSVITVYMVHAVQDGIKYFLYLESAASRKRPLYRSTSLPIILSHVQDSGQAISWR